MTFWKRERKKRAMEEQNLINNGWRRRQQQLINTWIPLPWSSSVWIALSWVKTCRLLQIVEPGCAEGLDCKTCTCKSNGNLLRSDVSRQKTICLFVFINHHSNKSHCFFSSSSVSLGDRCLLMYGWSMLIVNRRWHDEAATRQILNSDRREEKTRFWEKERREREREEKINLANARQHQQTES